MDATIVDVKLVSLAVGGGVALAFTLLATLCYLRWKNRTKMKDAGLSISAHISVINLP